MKSILLEMEKLKNPNSGLGQFCLHLGRQFHQLAPPSLKLEYYLPESQQNAFGKETTTVQHSVFHNFLPLESNQYDVWHCLHQNSDYFPSNKKTKLILTIHDLNFMEKYTGLKRAMKLGALQRRVDRAQAITVISRFTESVVRKYLDLNDKPIYVIPNGNALEPVENPHKPDFIQFRNFLFTIGIISKKKNFHTLLPFLQHDRHLHLVIAGDEHSNYAEELIHAAKKLNVAEQLHLPGTVNNEQKFWLYQNCTAFVFPALTEGFGLPVVEAMSVGKPVFLSNLTSLPEIGGPEAFYWSSFEPGSMIHTYEKGLQEFDAARAARSIAWARQFSWKTAATAYLKLYEEI